MLNDRRVLAPLSRIQDTLPDTGHGSARILATDGLEQNRPRAQVTATSHTLFVTDRRGNGMALSAQSIKDGGSSVKKLNGSLQKESRFTDKPVSFQGSVRSSPVDSDAHQSDPVIFHVLSVHRHHTSHRIPHLYRTLPLCSEFVQP